MYYYNIEYNGCFDKRYNISQQQQKYESCNPHK